MDDAALSNAQGEPLGGNLYVYCLDNPVSQNDSAGSSPLGILTLADYRLIHRIVQAICCAKYGWKMEIYVKGPKGVGFLDLYDVGANCYYKVKSDRASKYSSTAKQMQKYDVAFIRSKQIKNPSLKSPTRGQRYVSGKFVYGVWDVTFKLVAKGLIAYECQYNSRRGAQVLAVATIVTVAFCTNGLGATALGPLYALFA